MIRRSFVLLLAFTSFAIAADFTKVTQKGIGTISETTSHGAKFYVFVPKEPIKEQLRSVKMHYGRMGFRKGYPEEMAVFFKKAMEEKKR